MGIGLAGTAIGASIQQSPVLTVQRYDAAFANWARLLQRSHPNETLVVDFPLQDSERVFYSEPCQRYEERRPGQVINTQSRTKNAVGSAFVGAVVAGPAGAIVGSSMARRQTTGTATDVYAVVPVDDGVLTVTSLRVLFLGKRDTIELPSSRIIRIIEVERTD